MGTWEEPRQLYNGGYISLGESPNGGWRPALPEVVEYAGIGYFVEDWRNASAFVQDCELGTEFYAHELLKVDPGNIKSLTDFVSRWGLVFDPGRYGAARYFDWRDSKAYAGHSVPYSVGYFEEMGKAHKRKACRLMGIMQTDLATGFCKDIEFMPVQDLPSNIGFAGSLNGLDSDSFIALVGVERAYRPADELANASGVLGCPEMPLGAEGIRAVSVLETASAVRESQQIVYEVFEWLKRCCDNERPDTARKANAAGVPVQPSRFINGITRTLPVFGFADSHNDLLPAVFAQMLETLKNDREPWHICEKCGHPYKRKRNPSGMAPATSKRPPRSKYCSESCRNRYNYSERIKHGR